ncbi:MAG: hypothetical protein GY898_32130 [Proteobacteria bacterium]|nr:hypothetical protein [Pseudomonadota bacterium]
MRRAVLFVALALLLGCPEPEPEPVRPPPEDPGPWAVVGLAVSDAVINQGVEIPLWRNSAPVTTARKAPVIAGRPALVRLGLLPAEGWVRRDVLVEFTVVQADGSEATRQTVLEIDDAPVDFTDPEVSLNFELPASEMQVGTRIRATFWETARWEIPVLEGEPAAWPPDGTSEPLLPTDHGGVLRVDIVPIRYDFDGSGRMPDISPEQLLVLEEAMLGRYPAREVILEVRDGIAVDYEYDRGGEAMGATLSTLRDLRPSLDIAWDTYLYGMINPDETYGAFCNLGCTAGIGYRPTNPMNEGLRVGVGLGFAGPETGYVMAHEVGHGHDRGHAPCGGAANTDDDYPYAGGGIGVAGWDVISGEHIDPNGTADVMGYCQPEWVSDYTFEALHQRMAALEGLRDHVEDRSDGELWTAIDVIGGATTRWAPRAMVFEPEGEPIAVGLLDGAGRRIGKVSGWFVGMTHIDGGTVFVRGDLPGDVADVVIP